MQHDQWRHTTVYQNTQKERQRGLSLHLWSLRRRIEKTKELSEAQKVKLEKQAARADLSAQLWRFPVNDIDFLAAHVTGY